MVGYIFLSNRARWWEKKLNIIITTKFKEYYIYEISNLNRRCVEKLRKLIKKDNIVIDNLIHGGKSTTIYRSGTPALPLICSLMKALELVIPNIDKNYEYVSSLSRKIKDNLKKYDNIHINSTENSIPYIINFSVIGVKPETFIHTMEEEDIYLSTKSACSTSDVSLSVDSIYHNREISMSSIRISLSYKNTEEEIDKFIKAFDKIYNKLVFKK